MGNIDWSFAPYKPYQFDTGTPYICRIAPGETSVRLEWLPAGVKGYGVFARERGKGAFACVGTTDRTVYELTGLQRDTDYELYVTAGEDKSRVRLARTGAVYGVVVNYLHPDDEAYSFSGHALCSPSLVRHPDGCLLASMDVFAAGAPQNLTLLFRSDDDGRTWHYVSELMPCFWGKLFIHRGDLYMLACSTEYGDLLIGRSTDCGRTFSAPTVLLRGSGRSNVPGVHKNPQNVVTYNGRIYETLEWGTWSNGFHDVMVMSCNERADLLDAENWHFTPPVRYNPAWEGTAKGESSGNIEGTLVVAPDGALYNIMRYDMTRTAPCYGRVLAYRVPDDPDAPLAYSHAIAFPGNHSKFMIKRDGQTGSYYSIVSYIRGPEQMWDRNLLSLLRSEDLEHWSLVCHLIDGRDADPKKVGFQYVDFEIEGDDLLFLCRTAMNNAYNFHDANYSTFHRVRNFRQLPAGRI